MSSGSQAPKGLEGIVATTSSICYIDGAAGILAYRGVEINELAVKSNFEEVCYLLWYGRFPKSEELAKLNADLAAERQLPSAVNDLLRLVPTSSKPMDVLRTATSMLGLYDADANKGDHDANVRKAIRITSQMAMIVANFDRIRKGKALVEPDKLLSHAGNFLLMLNGEKPSDTATKTLDLALILHADHELNASTFAARVTAATLSDMHSAITSAIGALKGPLHGGANEDVMRLLLEIAKTGEDPVAKVRAMLAEKKKVPGMGHRVYKVLDPRAVHLAKMSESLSKTTGDSRWYDWSHQMQEFIKKEKNLNANVDFYSASTYHMLGLDIDLFTPIFALSRISGWAAHVIEQLDDNRLIRPRADYTGPAHPAPYPPMESR